MRLPVPRPAIGRAIIPAAAALILAVTAALAHFSEGTKVRTIVVTLEDGGLTALVRAPAPLVFSDLVGRSQVEQIPLQSPYLRFEPTADGERYLLDMHAIGRDRAGFERRLNGALIFSQAGLDLPGTVTGFTVHASAPDTPPGAPAAPHLRDMDDPAFGLAVIDYEVRLESGNPEGMLTVHSGYAPLLPGPGISIDNHLIDRRSEPPQSLTAPGQLEQPTLIGGSRLLTFVHYIHQGMLHILEGMDHVLLVIAMALGAGSIRRLVFLVTAFTAGHSATLVLTFLGAVPSWPWFIPAVETAIAASVLYAAAAAIVRKSGSVAVFAVIGLLHGLGFSFVLGDILGRDAPDLIVALLAFNIGIEFGQLLILSAVLLAVSTMGRLAAGALNPARLGVLGGIALLSSWWIAERLTGVFDSI